ncbi:hypothetical protein QFZ75_008055 [Streptomyces sp. V3I8]|uniref:hypothetical protein n=1 Tax=Streptomyces sp. V3I8 TaxID=3042279 RepID=UPI002780085E|nr:hypothetical protein [Streptomyces sp. V3I8]MDQ1041553.1 hypothetical protein [Streptomyces sp. V3I8]
MPSIATERVVRQTIDDTYTLPLALAAELLGCEEKDMRRLVKRSKHNAESGVSWPLRFNGSGVTLLSLLAYRTACRSKTATALSA